VTKHDREGNRQLTMVEMDIGAAHTGKVDPGDDRSWPWLGH
jgi:hypothetical protein